MDVTTILAAAIAGLAGVGGAYLGMRQQVQTMREQLHAEREREREKRGDEKLDARLQAYHDFLNVERELRTLLASKRTFSQSEYAKWTGEFMELYNLVVLTATEQVRKLTDQLFALFQDVDNERMSLGGERFADALGRAFQRYEVELEQTRVALIAAMRSDVASIPIPVDDLPAIAVDQPRPQAGPAVQRLAVIPEEGQVPADQVARVLAAIQTQISRDFGPAWNVDAHLESHATVEDAPADAWTIQVRHDIGQEASSYHFDDNGRPVGMVLLYENWSHALSHTCMEMLAAPKSDRFVSARSPKREQGEVQFLIQTCDPCMPEEYGYRIDDVLVSDFCTPRFYDDEKRTAGARYDQTGALDAPRHVAEGGYMHWYDPSTHHFWNGRRLGQMVYTDLGDYGDITRVVEAVRAEGQISFFGRRQADE